MTTRADQIEAFLATTDWADCYRTLVAGDASNRRYDRLTDANGRTAILMDAPPDKGEDVRPFVRVAEYLKNGGLSAPVIHAQDEARGLLVIEDLGDDLFASLLAHDPSLEVPLYEAAVDALIKLHETRPLALPHCDSVWMRRMNNLIFDWYAQGIDARDVAAFHDTFLPLAEMVDAGPKVVILRDYHAQNLLWLPDREGVARVGQLDFQDALLGHPAYDMVSVLQDARRQVDPSLEARMIDRYLARTGADRDSFMTAYAVLGAQRNLCILGIFARLCLRDGKSHYVDMIPRVWAYVQRDLAHPALSDLATVLAPLLRHPTLEFLEELKARCATTPS